MSSLNGSNENGSKGWGKLTITILAGMLLVSTLIIGITIPLSSSSSLGQEQRLAATTTTESASATTNVQNSSRDRTETNTSAAKENDNKNKDDEAIKVSGRSRDKNDLIKEVTLIAQESELEIAPGKVVKTWTFNGTMP